MVISRASGQKIVGTVLLSLLFILAFFFPYFQNASIKWQLSIVPAVLLWFTSRSPIAIRQFDLILLSLSIYCLTLFSLSGLPIHFNLSVVSLVVLFVSKIDIDETKIIAFFLAVLSVHHIVTGMLQSYDYTNLFNNFT